MNNKSKAPQFHKLNEVMDELRQVLSGRGSLLDIVLPGVLFLIFNAIFGFSEALWGSLAIGVGFALFRLVKHQSLIYVLLGLAGTAFTIFLSFSGGLAGYMLPDLVTGILTIGIAILSLLLKRPLVAWTSHFVRRWPRDWYWHPQIRPAYSEVTLAWAVFFGARLILEFALLESQNTLLLSLTKLLGGWPATIVLLIVSYLYGLWRLGNLAGPSVEEFNNKLPPPWKSQVRGF